MPSTQRCVYCGKRFVPDPRTFLKDGSTQKSCFRKRCRKKRQAEALARWRAANPDAFAGRYPKTKLWLKEHPGYLQCYRAQRPEYVAADNAGRRRRRAIQARGRADIRNAIHRRKIEAIRTLRGADIQNTIRLQIDGILTFLEGPERADIRNAIALPALVPVAWRPVGS